MRRSSLCLLTLAVAVSFAAPHPAGPHIFFSDIESGPNVGGEGVGGAYVTLYGIGFGASRDTSKVTVGGGEASAYPVWTDNRLSFQLGTSTVTGDVVVTTAVGVSNPLSFTVRPGRIHFVSPQGKDHSKGNATAPWRTILHARDAMAPGDITYLRSGVAQETNDDWSSCLLLAGKAGTAGKPIAFVAYPGESATIGSEKSTKNGGCDLGIRTKGEGEHYWVFAGLNLRGAGEAMALYGVHDWRVIGNDMTCPEGDGPSSCFGTGLTSNLRSYGNVIHDSGRVGASALYHGVYLGTDSNHIDFGWNTIANIHGCRGLQVHSSGGSDLFDLQIHDNLIHDTQCDGIILATVDPSKPGGVNLWNNVIYNAGKGPNTPEGSGAFFCINAQGWTNAGSPGSGTIEVFNNTMVACGTWNKPPYENANGGVSMNGPNPAKRLRLRNNIIFQPNAAPYIVMDDGKGHLCSTASDCDRISGSNNVLYGLPPVVANRYLTNTLKVNPQFQDSTVSNFRPSPSSRAISGGVPTPHVADRDGIDLQACKCRPIGAFTY